MYGKPKDINSARELIKSMEESDKIYAYVENAIIYANGDKIIKVINNCDISRMRMDKLPEEQLEDYLTNKKPLKRLLVTSIII